MRIIRTKLSSSKNISLNLTQIPHFIEIRWVLFPEMKYGGWHANMTFPLWAHLIHFEVNTVKIAAFLFMLPQCHTVCCSYMEGRETCIYLQRKFLQCGNIILGHTHTHTHTHTRVYPKVSGLATWSEKCKCYSSLPLGAVVSLFCE